MYPCTRATSTCSKTRLMPETSSRPYLPCSPPQRAAQRLADTVMMRSWLARSALSRAAFPRAAARFWPPRTLSTASEPPVVGLPDDADSRKVGLRALRPPARPRADRRHSACPPAQRVH